eukprot:TRINITY_DN32879_c0_g1_i1.p1 TRINITY_DN32879_c0_g1~~TRINITY_DN32879_c0_g1_i1.p1  ORF type:complete len:316 (+),score=57.50 TRINITY_DN32879_c0_g1_i1:107-1054(+)
MRGDPRLALEQPPHLWQCARSRWIVQSVEDLLAGRHECLDAQGLNVEDRWQATRCSNPFGHLVVSPFDYYGRLSMYVHVWKTGGSSIAKALESQRVGFETVEDIWTDQQRRHRTFLQEPFEHYGNPFLTEEGVDGVEAFTFVRHPLERFFSGYGTLVARLLKIAAQTPECLSDQMRAMLGVAEPERLRRFVVLLTSLGAALADHCRCAEHRCIFAHVLSQIWFLNFWPGPFAFVGRFEHLAEDWASFAPRLLLANDTLPHLNAAEGSDLFSEKDLVRMKMQQDVVQRRWTSMLWGTSRGLATLSAVMRWQKCQRA